MATNALDPAWLYLGTLTPSIVGLNVGTLTATLPSGPPGRRASTSGLRRWAHPPARAERM
jgi:hypothetical protein